MTVIVGSDKKELAYGETLLDCIRNLSAKVRFVDLRYSWPVYFRISIDTRIAAVYRGSRLDTEYSFLGFWDKDRLLKWAQCYSVWDENTLYLHNGILSAEEEGYNGDAEEFPEDSGEVDLQDYTDVGLCYYEFLEDGRWRSLRASL